MDRLDVQPDSVMYDNLGAKVVRQIRGRFQQRINIQRFTTLRGTMKRHPSIIYIAEHQAIVKNALAYLSLPQRYPTGAANFKGRVFREVTYLWIR